MFNKLLENRSRPHVCMNGECSHNQETNFFRALTQLFPFLGLLGGLLLWILFSPTNIMKRHPYLILYVLGITFGYLSSNMTLSYLLKSPLKRFSMILIPIFIALSNVIVVHTTGYEKNLLICMLTRTGECILTKHIYYISVSFGIAQCFTISCCPCACRHVIFFFNTTVTFGLDFFILGN